MSNSGDVFSGVMRWFMNNEEGNTAQIAAVVLASPDEVKVALRILELLGLVELQGQAVRITHVEHVRYILKSWLALGDRSILGDLNHKGNERTWVRVLRAIEARRLALDGDTTAMRNVNVAVALIVGHYNGDRYVLVEKGRGMEGTRFGLPGGPAEKGGYSIDTIIRQLKEEIQGDIEDCLSLNRQRIHLEPVEPDVDVGALTHFTLDVYSVAEYLGKRITFVSDPNKRNIGWVSLSAVEMLARSARRRLTAALAHTRVREAAAMTKVLYAMNEKDSKRVFE